MPNERESEMLPSELSNIAWGKNNRHNHRSGLNYRVLVRGTLHRGELVESSSLPVLPSAFGSTVVLLSEVFR